MTRKALNRALLARQMLLAREKVSAPAVMERLVGLQAQQARPPFVGLWSRIEGFRREELLDLIHGGEVVRATMMRATLHLMTAGDYRAFRPAIQPALSAGMRSILRDRLESFSLEDVLAEARRLYAERPRTFTELREALIAAFPEGDERAMGYSVRLNLPLVIAPTPGHEWGYRADGDFMPVDGCAVAAEPHQLILRYLAAFGPASVADIQAWSALSGLAPVLKELRSQLQVFRDERKRELFDLPEAPRPPEETPVPVRFVADFDNLVLSHADRTRVISDEQRKVVVTKNGLVLPTFLVDGFVAGSWKVTRAKKTAVLTLTPFGALSGAVREELAAEGEQAARFLEPEAVGFELRIEE